MNNRIFHQSVCIKLKNMLVFFRYLETYFWKQEFSKNVIFLVGKLWSWVTIIFTIKTLAKKDNSKIERCVNSYRKRSLITGTLLYILCLKISQVSSWCLTLRFTQLFIVSNFYRHLTEIETLKPYREMLLIKNININLIINYYNWLLKLRHIDIFKVP